MGARNPFSTISAATAGIAAAVLVIGFGSPPVNAATVRCQPDEVAVLRNLVQVRCEVPIGGISYFAVPIFDAEHATRMLHLMSTALVAGRSMQLTYEPSDVSGGEFGCAPNNCRYLRGAAFGK